MLVLQVWVGVVEWDNWGLVLFFSHFGTILAFLAFTQPIALQTSTETSTIFLQALNLGAAANCPCGCMYLFLDSD